MLFDCTSIGVIGCLTTYFTFCLCAILFSYFVVKELSFYIQKKKKDKERSNQEKRRECLENTLEDLDRERKKVVKCIVRLNLELAENNKRWLNGPYYSKYTWWEDISFLFQLMYHYCVGWISSCFYPIPYPTLPFHPKPIVIPFQKWRDHRKKK